MSQFGRTEKLMKPKQLEFTTNKGQVTISESGKHRIRVQALDQKKNPLTEEVSNKEDFSSLLLSKTLQKNRYLIKNRIPMGQTLWRVRANPEDTSKSSRWSDLREFTLFKNIKGGFGK